MFTAALLGLVAQATAPAPTPVPVLVADPRMTRMAALYEEVCLKAFPDDTAVDTLMAAKGASALTPEEVKVTLVDDPGRGWTIQDEGKRVLIILETPPYHACSVRWPAPAGTPDMMPYRAVADRYMATRTGWTTMPPMEMDRGDIHISATMSGRMSGRATETLMVIDQTPADPARRAAGEGGVDRRLVHQMRER